MKCVTMQNFLWCESRDYPYQVNTILNGITDEMTNLNQRQLK